MTSIYYSLVLLGIATKYTIYAYLLGMLIQGIVYRMTGFSIYRYLSNVK